MVAAVTLANPAQRQNETYRLSGPQALTYGEAVAMLAQSTGKPLRVDCR